MQKRFLAATLVAAAGASSAFAYAPQFAQYYVGRDLRRTIPTGAYAGLPNPNFGRITMLFGHTYADDPATAGYEPAANHYHGKSPYTYFGPANGAATTVQPYNGAADGTPGNYLPEGGTFGNSPKLQLLPGSGQFAGKYVSGLAGTTSVDREFGKFRFRSTDALAGFAAGTPQAVLFNAGGNAGVTDPDGAGPQVAPNRYTGSMAGTDLALRVVSITPGLSVDAGDATLNAAGQQVAIGSGGGGLDFTPVLYTGDGVGSYSVTFKLVDTGTADNGKAFGESGQFTINAVVPEPAAAAACGVLGVGLLRRRRPPAGRRFFCLSRPGMPDIFRQNGVLRCACLGHFRGEPIRMVQDAVQARRKPACPGPNGLTRRPGVMPETAFRVLD